MNLRNLFLLFLFSLINFKTFAVITVSDDPSTAWPVQSFSCSDTVASCVHSAAKTFDFGGTWYICEFEGLVTSGGGKVYLPYKNGSECTTPTGYSSVGFLFSGSAYCQTSDECLILATQDCASMGEDLKDYEFLGVNDYPHSCGVQTTPEDDCYAQQAQSCSSSPSLNSYPSYIDDGFGNFTCSGYCSSERQSCSLTSGLGDCIPDPDCVGTPENNFCDTSTPPDTDLDVSNTDFTGGSSGTSIDSPVGGNQFVEDLDYIADGKAEDGSALDPTSPFSALQGDVVINELRRNSDDNAQFVTETAKTTNLTIVEKSDDISSTVSAAANGIINAVNSVSTSTFSDSAILSSISSLSTAVTAGTDKIDSGISALNSDLGSALGSDYVTSTIGGDFLAYDGLFNLDSRTLIEEQIASLKLLVATENDDFGAALRQNFSFSSSGSSGYEERFLDLGKWGSHDISMSRFADFFGGLGTIVYLLAALTSFVIVLGGIKF